MLLENTIIYKPLLPGCYDVKLTEFTEVAGKEGKDNYVQLTLTFPNGRQIIDNLFVKSLPISMSQLDQQLNADASPNDGINALTILQQAKALPSVKIWISYYRPDETTSYRNINFIAPRPQAEADPSATATLTADDF